MIIRLSTCQTNHPRVHQVSMSSAWFHRVHQSHTSRRRLGLPYLIGFSILYRRLTLVFVSWLIYSVPPHQSYWSVSLIRYFLFFSETAPTIFVIHCTAMADAGRGPQFIESDGPRFGNVVHMVGISIWKVERDKKCHDKMLKHGTWAQLLSSSIIIRNTRIATFTNPPLMLLNKEEFISRLELLRSMDLSGHLEASSSTSIFKDHSIPLPTSFNTDMKVAPTSVTLFLSTPMEKKLPLKTSNILIW